MKTFNKYLKKIYIDEHLKTLDLGPGQYIEFHKNPSDILMSKLTPYTRAVFTKQGNLYVAYVVDDGDFVNYIHSDIVQWLSKNGVKELQGCTYSEGDNPLDYLDEFITLDYSANCFLLAESYDDLAYNLDSFDEEFTMYKNLLAHKYPKYPLILGAE